MLIENNVKEVMNHIDSDSPVPGGGSVSALVAALGICLARMYGHLSVNKKKFLALEPQVQENFKTSFERFNAHKEKLIQAIDDDCEAYDQVMQAYRLPKTTPSEQVIRQEAILKATDVAIASPYGIMQEAIEAMKLCASLVEDGNANAISDLACGVVFLAAAIEGASLNVRINLAGLDELERQQWTQKIEDCLTECHQLKATILEQVMNRL